MADLKDAETKISNERTGMTDDVLVRAVIDHLRFSFANNNKTAAAIRRAIGIVFLDLIFLI